MTHLMIKDLEASRELDTHAMQSVRGGMDDLTSVNSQFLIADAKAGVAAIVTATQVLTDVNLLLDLDVSPTTNIRVGGIN